MGNVRSISLSEKNDKRAKIQSTALQAFEYLSFHDITMSYLADRVNIAKGTLYLYFPTKEALFLSLLSLEMKGWFKSIGEQLSESNDLAKDLTISKRAEMMGNFFIVSTKKHIKMIELLSFLKPVLEEKVAAKDISEFKDYVKSEMLLLSKSLVVAKIFPQEKVAMRFLVQSYSSLIGLYQVSSISKYESDKELIKAHINEFFLMLATFLQTLYLGSLYTPAKLTQLEHHELKAIN